MSAHDFNDGVGPIPAHQRMTEERKIWEGRPSQWVNLGHWVASVVTMEEVRLRAFLSAYGLGYRLVLCDRPHSRPDAVGIQAWGSGDVEHTARLCENRVIAATDALSPTVHAIAHEVAHQQVSDRFGCEYFGDENKVGVEQIAFMDRWCGLLMGELMNVGSAPCRQ